MPKASVRSYLRLVKRQLPWLCLLTNLMLCFGILVTRDLGSDDQPQEQPEVLRARKLVLADSEGNNRAILNTRDDGLFEFCVLDQAGESQVQLTSDGESSVDFMIGPPQNRVLLRSDQAHSEVALLNALGMPSVRLMQQQEQAALLLLSPSQRPYLALMGNQDVRQLVVYDTDSAPRIGLGLDPQGPALVLQDSNRIPRVGVSLIAETPKIVIQDQSAIPRGVIEQSGRRVTAQLNGIDGAPKTWLSIEGMESISESNASMYLPTVPPDEGR